MVSKSVITVESSALKGNLPEDRTTREVIVYTPDNPKQKAPLLIGLPPFGMNHETFVARTPLTEGLEDILARLYSKEMLKGSVVAIPDCFTKFGGNQYINSSAVGMYENFLTQELIPQIRDKYNTGPTGLFGKGSGGFGAYTVAVRNPGIVNGFASHSMDAGFEFSYLPEFPLAMEEFRRVGSPKIWLDRYYRSFNRISTRQIRTLGVIAYSAFYSPDQSSQEMGIDFPFDWVTGKFRDDVWSRWLAWDPARNIVKFSRQLDMLRTIYLDVGVQDEYSLMWGSRSVDAFLIDNKVNHVYEEYEDGHFGVAYRMEKSLAILAAGLG